MNLVSFFGREKLRKNHGKEKQKRCEGELKMKQFLVTRESLLMLPMLLTAM